MELTYRNKKKEKEILEIINKKYKEVENNKLSFITENSFYINEDNFYAMIKLLKNTTRYNSSKKFKNYKNLFRRKYFYELSNYNCWNCWRYWFW